MEAQTDEHRRTKQDDTIGDDERGPDRAPASDTEPGDAGPWEAGNDGHCYAATLLLKLKYDREHFDEIDWDQLRHGGF